MMMISVKRICMAEMMKNLSVLSFSGQGATTIESIWMVMPVVAIVLKTAGMEKALGEE